MKLNQTQFEALCKTTIDAATKAGQLIAKRSQEQLLVNKKAGGESLASQVFTEVDLASEKIILEALKPSMDKYDLALLSEESPDDKSRFEKDYFWCIDPLDGTLPFIEQTDGYSVSIALVDKKGTPYIGIIYNPVNATLYHAIKGVGAFKNHQPWRLKESKTQLTLVCDRSFLKQNDCQAICMQLQSTFGAYHLISHGGAAMNAMWALENHPAIYFKKPKDEKGGGSVWDYAASACIYKEIGAIAQSFNGKALELNPPDSTFMNHKGIFYASDKLLFTQISEFLVQ